MKNSIRDRIRGSLFGGAVGDALGYQVEFLRAQDIFTRYGENGIQKYVPDPVSGKALISDDTQMTLFTVEGILDSEDEIPHSAIVDSYLDWLLTQEISFEEADPESEGLLGIPELYALRAPGNTCLSALGIRQNQSEKDGFVENPINHSKGCGGVMRVAPIGLMPAPDIPIKEIDREAAEVAAITHGHSLGYMPASVLAHIIRRIVYPEQELSLKQIVVEAKETAAGLFRGDKHLPELEDLIDLAVKLSENEEDDLVNIRRLGEGWVAEETLAIALYCSLKYQDDFSAGVIAAVNHSGDSDSTGAVTGNILGALAGYSLIEEKWKEGLELADVIIEMADALAGE